MSLPWFGGGVGLSRGIAPLEALVGWVLCEWRLVSSAAGVTVSVITVITP